MLNPFNSTQDIAAVGGYFAQQAVPGILNSQVNPVIGVIFIAFGVVTIAAGITKSLAMAAAGVVLIFVGLWMSGLLGLIIPGF